MTAPKPKEYRYDGYGSRVLISEYRGKVTFSRVSTVGQERNGTYKMTRQQWDALPREPVPPNWCASNLSEPTTP